MFSCGGMRYQQSWTRGGAGDASTARRTSRPPSIARWQLGINHFETARGYGTSEAQLGPALARHPRDAFMLQTKVRPIDDPREFERSSRSRSRCLQVDTWICSPSTGSTRPQCLDHNCGRAAAGRWPIASAARAASGTSASPPTAPPGSSSRRSRPARFDYVNLHYYYIFQDNRPVLGAARRARHGRVHHQPDRQGRAAAECAPKLRALCAPLSPLVFNDLWCLAHPDIHTLSLGAARPSDFDEHLQVLPLLADPQRAQALVPPIVARLEAAYARRSARTSRARWREGLREWTELPGRINVRRILWLRQPGARLRSASTSRRSATRHDARRPLGPGRARRRLRRRATSNARSPDSPFRTEIPGLLGQAHAGAAQPGGRGAALIRRIPREAEEPSPSNFLPAPPIPVRF